MVKHCQTSIECKDVNAYANGTFLFDNQRVLERECTPPRNGGRDCDGDSKTVEPCPPVLLPVCNDTNGKFMCAFIIRTQLLPFTVGCSISCVM